MKKNRKAVCVFGTPLVFEDSIALRVLEYLEKTIQISKNGTDWIDCGTDVFSVPYMLDKYDKIIIIDSAKMGLKGGEVRKIKLDDLREDIGVFRSSHTISLFDIIKLTDIKDKDIFIIGIEIFQETADKDILLNKIKDISYKVLKLIQKEEIFYDNNS